MDSKWIHESWDRREDPLFSAMEESWVAAHRLLPVFFGCFLFFVGFDEETEILLKQLAESNGATVVPRRDRRLTHIIIGGNFQGDFQELCDQFHVVKAQWLQRSIDMAFKVEVAFIWAPSSLSLAPSSLSSAPSSLSLAPSLLSSAPSSLSSTASSSAEIKKSMFGQICFRFLAAFNQRVG